MPAAAQQDLPEVDTSIIWIATVERGDLASEVRGPGVLERFGRGFHAHVRIAASQAAALELDQTATIDTRADLLSGRVVHIADRVEEGTLTVVVELTDDLPASLRPGLAIDARVRVGYMENVLYVDRPAYAQADQAMGIFKIFDNQVAERVPVTWGPSSVEKIVVAEGLEVGDRIILSDMSRYDSSSRLQLVGR